MTYTPIFKPKAVWRAPDAKPEKSIDCRDGSVYVFHSDRIAFAVNIALATGRPLFLRGASGDGKSSLARSVARILERRYYELVISSRVTVQDLLWRVDSLRRLEDAQMGQLSSKTAETYIEPGLLWWAFDPESAREMGGGSDPARIDWATEPLTQAQRDAKAAVVLLDEIDKAEPDLPNDLLVPLGSLRFTVEPIDRVVAARSELLPLVIITTNEERQMPPAFLRRCVVLDLPRPSPEKLIDIACAHFGDEAKDKALFSAVADRLQQPDGQRSTAEFLDAVRACMQLSIAVDDPEWHELDQLTLRKQTGELGG